jgi:hypothetical protein
VKTGPLIFLKISSHGSITPREIEKIKKCFVLTKRKNSKWQKFRALKVLNRQILKKRLIFFNLLDFILSSST